MNEYFVFNGNKFDELTVQNIIKNAPISIHMNNRDYNLTKSILNNEKLKEFFDFLDNHLRNDHEYEFNEKNPSQFFDYIMHKMRDYFKIKGDLMYELFLREMKNEQF